MAQGINEMVAGHIAVKKKAMACVKAFGEGDFDAPLEHSPARRPSSTTRSRRSDQSPLDHRRDPEPDRRIPAGRLGERGNATRHVGDFAKVVLGINGMLDAIILPIMEGNRVLSLVSAAT